MRKLTRGEYTGEIIRKMDIEGSIISNTLYSTKRSNPAWHYHENLHICFVFQGGKAETRSRSLYADKEGGIFFYHAEETHRWISPQAVSKSVNIEIGKQFLDAYNLSEDCIKEAIHNRIDSRSIMLKMQQEILMNDENSHSAVHALLLELISSPGAFSQNKPPAWLAGLIELLHENWNEALSLVEMANLLQVHPVTISKYFRKYFSCTLGEYRRKLRIEKSISLIKDSDQSLADIAFHCGFSDQSHFTRNFKEKTGFLPKDFRNY